MTMKLMNIVKDVSVDEPRSYNVVQPRRHIRTTGEHHQVANGSDDDPSEGSGEIRRDVADDNPNADRDATSAKPERHVTFAPDRSYQTRSGRSVKLPRRLEL